MESSQLVSWQFEDFSTAELSFSTSPVSPSSPLFYHDGGNPASPSSSKMAPQQSQKCGLSSALSSRAQLASNVLNEIERLNSYENRNDFMHEHEESVDLNTDLFDELDDIAFTPNDIKIDDGFAVPSSPVNVPPTDKLSAEFKSIVESLNVNVQVTSPLTPVVSSIGDLFQITGIPTTTIVGDECLVPVELIGRPSTTQGEFGATEVESMDLDGIIISNDMALINESELFSLQEISDELMAEEITDSKVTDIDGTIPYWTKDITIPVDELDTAISKNDATLNALLQGDVSTAKNFMTSETTQQPFSPVSTASEEFDPSVLEEAEVIEVIEEPAPKKIERRGRKPNKKDSLTFIKDKALRKKEQNKTAATRYRQKKKKELVVTLSQEDELQAVHDDLSGQRDKLSTEIKMIRSLLRDMLQARKKRPSPSPALNKLTASSIVQAQKLANRRK